ncbi:MAG: hypothetical protein HFI33_15070 [Lachnospiraceae bacterium]|nr:hypothetical protein [Lachnospiraceae bacterium]
MGNDDFILDSIFNILQADTEKPEDGYFRSIREKASRCEAIRQMFCGLRKESQDKVLWLAMELLIGQNSPGIGAEHEIIVKGGLA